MLHALTSRWYMYPPVSCASPPLSLFPPLPPPFFCALHPTPPTALRRGATDLADLLPPGVAPKDVAALVLKPSVLGGPQAVRKIARVAQPHGIKVGALLMLWVQCCQCCWCSLNAVGAVLPAGWRCMFFKRLLM